MRFCISTLIAFNLANIEANALTNVSQLIVAIRQTSHINQKTFRSRFLSQKYSFLNTSCKKSERLNSGIRV